MSYSRGRPSSRSFVRLAAVGASVALLLGAMVPGATAKSHHSKSSAQTVTVHRVGTSHITSSSSATASTAIPAADIQPDVESNAAEVNKNIPNSLSYARVPSRHVPRPATSSVSAATTTESFAGLNHFDQHESGNDAAGVPTQWSLEPPDQALCVGNGFVVESVNTAIRVLSTDGTVEAGAMPLNAFFGLAPEYEYQPDGSRLFGPFTSDPKCYYDSDTGRFFLSLLEIGVNENTNAFLPHAYQLLAVSKTGDPTGAWYLYSWETTNDSGSANCPCFGDQPLIGADAYGFYVTTNEFPIFNAGFNGANIYAFSKSALASGDTTTQAQFFNEPSLAEGYAYSLQPTTTPPGGTYAAGPGDNGAEYFLSALDFNGTLDNRIALWALTNTASLDSASPDLSLSHVVMHSEVYGQPPAMTQPNGPTPLKDLLNAPKNPLTGVPMGEHLNLLNSNDDRMNQAVFADGMVWGALNTVVKSPTGPTRTGIAYFIVTPSWDSGLGGSVTKQGYVAVKNNNVVFPAIAANADGAGIMSFTLVGRNFYPSAAYVTVNATDGAGSVQLVKAGAGPADGFSGYLTFDPPDAGVARWGDYGAAVAAEDGSIWFAAEMINQKCSFSEFLGDTTCGGTRTFYANWGTWIANVNP